MVTRIEKDEKGFESALDSVIALMKEKGAEIDDIERFKSKVEAVILDEGEVRLKMKEKINLVAKEADDAS